MSTHEFEEFQAFKTWQEAQANSSGYESPGLVAALFNQFQQSPPWQEIPQVANSRLLELFAVIQYIRQRHQFVDLWDIGGGNGYLGCQINALLPDEDRMRWTVLESESIAKAYSEVSAPDWLEFRPLRLNQFPGHCDVAVLSCALNYIEDFESLLLELALHTKWIILMRLPVSHQLTDHVPTVQTPQDLSLYHECESSWPSWWFSESRLDRALNSIGTIQLRWETDSESWIFSSMRHSLHGRLIDCR